MVLEITNSEKDLIFKLIESAHREMIREIDHTDAREFTSDRQKHFCFAFPIYRIVKNVFVLLSRFIGSPKTFLFCLPDISDR
jgi:hypothetical protein